LDVKQYARMWGLSIAHPYILYRKQLTGRMLGSDPGFPQLVFIDFQAEAVPQEELRLRGEFDSWPLAEGFFSLTGGIEAS
jgi:hypothetical protein